MIPAGDLQERVTFQRPTRSVSASGAVTLSWADFMTVATVWAKVESERTGDEVTESDALVARGQWKITIRYRTDIDAEDRISYRGRILYISSIDQVSPRDGLITITATENNA